MSRISGGALCLMLLWSRRFRGNLLPLARLVTRGWVRSRLTGLGRWRISARACRMFEASRSGGRTRLPGDVAADDAQGPDERHAQRVELVGVGGLIHQRADRIVGQQQCPDLLTHHLGALRAQDSVAATPAGFDLGEARFEFPALVIDRGELTG